VCAPALGGAVPCHYLSFRIHGPGRTSLGGGSDRIGGCGPCPVCDRAVIDPALTLAGSAPPGTPGCPGWDGRADRRGERRIRRVDRTRRSREPLVAPSHRPRLVEPGHPSLRPRGAWHGSKAGRSVTRG